MWLANLPAVITAFVEAANAGNIRGLVATFAADAAVFDREREHRGHAIVHWGNWFFMQPRKLVYPIRVVRKNNEMLLSVIVCDTGRAKPEQLDWSFTMAGQRIAALSIRNSEVPDMPPSVAAYILATNVSDIDGILNTFAENAVVNDQLYEYRGRSAIHHWAVRHIIGQRTAIFAVKAVQQHGNAVVTAHVNGDNDRKSSPDPLLLTFYFSVVDEKIVQLIILRSVP